MIICTNNDMKKNGKNKKERKRERGRNNDKEGYERALLSFLIHTPMVSWDEQVCLGGKRGSG